MTVGLMYREPSANKQELGISILFGLLTLGFLGFPTVLMSGNTPYPSELVTVGTTLAVLIWTASVSAVRTYPLLGLALATVGGLLTVICLPYPAPIALVVIYISYQVARWAPGRASRSVLGVGALGVALAVVRWVGIDGYDLFRRSIFDYLVTSFVLAVACSAAVILPYLVGRRFRDVALRKAEDHRRDLDAIAMQLQTQQQRVLAQEAQQRNAIARELHDIIAHSLSVMIVQAEGAKAIAEKNPATAISALDTIAETGRDALAEARRMVSILRRDANAPGVEYAPTPTPADIPDLVARSGDRFRYSAEGTLPAVSPAVGLAAYRITQEAITNVVKHAGPEASAVVRLTYSPREILVEVIDDGLGSQAETDGRGNGITGMHERAASVGGHVIAQPQSGGGFYVRASLPVSLSA